MSHRIETFQCEPGSDEFREAFFNVRGTTESASSTITGGEKHLIACFVAVRDNVVSGRVAVYLNPEILHETETALLLGNFECIDDQDICNALLDAASGLCNEYGATWMIGPMNGSTWNSYRFITAGHHAETFVTEMQHPAYYVNLWMRSGFVAVSQYVSNLAPIGKLTVDETIFSENNLKVRSLDAANLEAALRRVFGLVSEAFSGSPYYSSSSENEFVAKLMPLNVLLSNSFTRIVDDSDGNPVAFILCIPDVLDPSKKRLVVKTAAKSRSCTVPGIITMLNRQIMNDAAAAGFSEAIHAFMHVSNRSIERSMDFSGIPIRQYALFAKHC